MKNFLLTIVLLLNIIICFAQQNRSKDLFTFRITDYTVKLNDSTMLVQVQPPPGAVIIEKQLGVLRGNSNSALDTAMIGWGRCQLIKGDYYYFSIHLANNKRLPKKGDLLYTKINYPASYKGRIFGLIQLDIYLQRVTEESFYTFTFAVSGDVQQENSVMDSLAADIKYTAREMLKISPDQNMLITTGKYKDKKLFIAMQEISGNDVKDFIDYILYMPTRYEGNNWKISETFATWMVSGTPMVIK